MVTTTTRKRVHTGNRITVEIAGEVVGLVQSIRGSDDYGLEPASGIGDIHVLEYVPSTARHTVSVQGMVLLEQGPLSRHFGEFAENGSAAMASLVCDIVIYAPDATFNAAGGEVASYNTNILRKYHNCTYASGDIDVTAHKIVVNNAQFNALDVSNGPNSANITSTQTGG